jgi:hypothetical protein
VAVSLPSAPAVVLTEPAYELVAALPEVVEAVA